jgi:DnaK suppressor protein
MVQNKASMSGTDGVVDIAGDTLAANETPAGAPSERKAPARKAPARKKAEVAGVAAGQDQGNFLESQRLTLLAERADYIGSAESLKAQADSLALEHEPGDVQFDEEGGEGGTANVDREIDLYLSAQARATVAEIDRALAKIEDGTYGVCERCGQAIPEARLEALPYAALCVACKSGGLSSRR